MKGDIAYNNILVPVDETDMAKRVIAHALHVAKIERARLVLMHVARKKMIESVFPKELSQKMLEVASKNIESTLEYAKSSAENVGIPLETIILIGDDIGDDIIRIAQERNINLTVMGSESLRTNPLGSLARRLIAADIGPVLVITNED
jgi:nucleotide-binding universal stress UspA family protein